ncbi:MAG: tRNA dihydrouridine synthase DusB [Bacteroidetes bacterium]|nr:MAG: tRNA dihydrouridine synthase DusB [Bacteroidota bacterium]
MDSLTAKKVWLAPLAGITDKTFRTICKECGADVVVSEMISADGLIYNLNRSIQYAYFNEEQRPFGIQLFGSEPYIMAKATEIILEKKPDFIDLNMGCPVKKVTKRGAGCALMRTPSKAKKIVLEVKSVLKGTKIPLSIKIRSGWNKNNAISFSKILEDAGAEMICIHPRTKIQMFSGNSDWNIIRELKNQVSIPIIGNGDIRNALDGKKMFNFTGCNSIMLGRGILGKPWLFTEIKELILFNKIIHLSYSEKLNIIEHHFNLDLKDKGEGISLREMRKHFSYYTKGIKGGAKIRNFINNSLNSNSIMETIRALFLNEEKIQISIN